MKKAVCGLFALAILFTCTLTAFAGSSTSYRLDDLGMTIDIPNDLTTLTRDNLDSKGSALSKLGITSKEMQTMMKNQEIYLTAYDEAIKHEVVITNGTTPLSELSNYTDAELTEMIFDILPDFKKKAWCMIILPFIQTARQSI